MAYSKYGLSSDLLKKLRPHIIQWESATGRSMPAYKIQALAESILGEELDFLKGERALDVQQEIAEKNLAISQGYLDLAREQAAKEEEAAKWGGIGELATGAASLLGGTTGLFAGGGGGAAGVGSGLPALSAAVDPVTGALTTGAVSGGAFVGGAGTLGGQVAAEAPYIATGLGSLVDLPAAGAGTVATATPTIIGEGLLGGVTPLGALGGAGLALGAGYLGSELGKQEWFQSITPWGGEKTEEQLGGALTGALVGTAILPGIGTVIGGLLGWAGSFIDDICIIVTTCTNGDEYKIDIARQYRDKFMDKEQIRGYYMIAEKYVPIMKRNPEYKETIKTQLVDRLIDYGEWKLGKKDKVSDLVSIGTSEAFLERCRRMGMSVKSFMRSNGEVI